MNIRKVISILAVLMLVITGCADKINTEPSDTEASSTISKQKIAAENSDEKSKGYDWIIEVNDSKNGSYAIPMSDKTMNFTVNLYFIAWKNGGNDIYGNYNGRALITFDIDNKSFSDEEINYSGNVLLDSLCDEINFKIAQYNKDEYDKIKKTGPEELSLAPLGTFNGMSIFSPMFIAGRWGSLKAVDKDSGKVVYDENYANQDDEKFPVSINLLTGGDRVTVDIPTYNSVWKLDFFRGSITQNKEGKDPIKLFRDKLLDRIEQNQKFSENKTGGEQSNSEPPSDVNGKFITDSEGREGFDLDGDGKLDMWMDENDNMRMDLDKDGKWDPVIEGEYSDGAIGEK